MTMYLPNGDVRPTGFEAGEFIDAQPAGEDLGSRTPPEPEEPTAPPEGCGPDRPGA